VIFVTEVTNLTIENRFLGMFKSLADRDSNVTQKKSQNGTVKAFRSFHVIKSDYSDHCIQQGVADGLITVEDGQLIETYSACLAGEY
jgi:hypothetical protein